MLMLGNVGRDIGGGRGNVKRDRNNDEMISISEFLLCVSIVA